MAWRVEYSSRGNTTQALSLIFAGAVTGALPMVILFFFLQRFISVGVARSGIKG
jgi:ABC-type maltose transport system permease subunit